MIKESDLAYFLSFVVVQSPSLVLLFATPWTAACQAAPSPCPEVCPSWWPLHRRYHPAISSSDAFFSFCHQSFPASGSFPMSQLFASASASVLPVSVQDWLPLRLTGFISLLSKGLSGVFSCIIVWRHQIFSTLPSLWFFSVRNVLRFVCVWPK